LIRWLEDNPVGMALAATCGGLLLVSLILTIMWALPAPSNTPDGEAGSGEKGLALPEPEVNEPVEKYTVVTERPVFNESRLPSLDMEIEEEEAEEDLVEIEVPAPEVELAGVIITPTMRMATLRQKEGSNSLVAFEGKPLEGDFGTWQVSRIEPRLVTLQSGSGEELELELQVHDAVIEEPPEDSPEDGESDEGAPERDAQLASRDAGDPMTRADEIRQRIAERREELRRAAEEEQESVADEQQPTYQQAIESMMGRNRQEESRDDQ
jgi:hypothetical protein